MLTSPHAEQVLDIAGVDFVDKSHVDGKNRVIQSRRHGCRFLGLVWGNWENIGLDRTSKMGGEGTIKGTGREQSRDERRGNGVNGLVGPKGGVLWFFVGGSGRDPSRYACRVVRGSGSVESRLSSKQSVIGRELNLQNECCGTSRRWEVSLLRQWHG